MHGRSEYFLASVFAVVGINYGRNVRRRVVAESETCNDSNCMSTTTVLAATDPNLPQTMHPSDKGIVYIFSPRRAQHPQSATALQRVFLQIHSKNAQTLGMGIVATGTIAKGKQQNAYPCMQAGQVYPAKHLQPMTAAMWRRRWCTPTRGGCSLFCCSVGARWGRVQGEGDALNLDWASGEWGWLGGNA